MILACFYCSYFTLEAIKGSDHHLFLSGKFGKIPTNKLNYVDKFWRGTIEEAIEAFSARHLKGEITLLIEGATIIEDETLSDSQLENELGDLISKGHSLSMAVKLVASGTSMKRKAIYSVALEKFGKLGQHDSLDKS